MTHDTISFRVGTFRATLDPSLLYELPAAQSRKLLRLLRQADDPAAYQGFGLLLGSAVQLARSDYLSAAAEPDEDPATYHARRSELKRRADRTKKLYEIYLEEIK